MSDKNTSFIVFVGPLRDESNELIKQTKLPSLVINSHNISAALAKQNNVEYISATIANECSKITLYAYNLSEFNSLSKATGLKELYPGLREAKESTVETQTLARVLQARGKLSQGMVQLILEQPEQSLSLLRAWQSEGLLDALETLWVRTSPISLFENMPVQQELISWCDEQGFEIDSHNQLLPSQDPEFLLLCFKRKKLYTKLKNAQKEAAQIKAERDSFVQQYGKLQADYKTLSKNHDELKLSFNEAQESCEIAKNECSHLKKRRDELKKQLEGLHERENIQAECDRFAEQANERQQQIHVIQRKNQKLERENQQLLERQNQLHSELIKAEAHVEIIKGLMIDV